jgi:hypothetical protein
MNDDFHHDAGPGLFASRYFWAGLIVCVCLLGALASCIFGASAK